VYAAASANRLFVIATATNGVTGEVGIAGSLAALGVAPNGAFVYVANPPNRVSVVDTAAASVTRTIAVGTYPAGVAFTPDGAFAYVGSGGILPDGGTISVIDAQTQMVTTTISSPAGTPASPASVAVANVRP
jgi:YVTN family beta-propeller protein